MGFRLDRVSRPKPLIVPHLSVSIYGTVQPDRLAAVLRGVDDGLVGRFLWSWPTPLPFRRPIQGCDIQSATNALCRLADLRMKEDDSGALRPVFIPLTRRGSRDVRRLRGAPPQAQEAAVAWIFEGRAWQGERPSASVGDRPGIPLVGRFRSCGASGDPAAGDGGGDWADGSVLLAHASRIFSDAAVPDDEKNARTLARWIVSTRAEKVNVTEIRDKARLPGLCETTDVKAACRFPCRGTLAFGGTAQLGRAGRPAGDFRVNPRLWDVLAQADN